MAWVELDVVSPTPAGPSHPRVPLPGTSRAVHAGSCSPRAPGPAARTPLTSRCCSSLFRSRSASSSARRAAVALPLPQTPRTARASPTPLRQHRLTAPPPAAIFCLLLRVPLPANGGAAGAAPRSACPMARRRLLSDSQAAQWQLAGGVQTAAAVGAHNGAAERRGRAGGTGERAGWGGSQPGAASALPPALPHGALSPPPIAPKPEHTLVFFRFIKNSSEKTFLFVQ